MSRKSRKMSRDINDTHKENCFAQFNARIYGNRILTASHLFPMFAQSINFYTFFCQILKSTDV